MGNGAALSASVLAPILDSTKYGCAFCNPDSPLPRARTRAAQPRLMSRVTATRAGTGRGSGPSGAEERGAPTKAASAAAGAARHPSAGAGFSAHPLPRAVPVRRRPAARRAGRARVPTETTAPPRRGGRARRSRQGPVGKNAAAACACRRVALPRAVSVWLGSAARRDRGARSR